MAPDEAGLVDDAVSRDEVRLLPEGVLRLREHLLDIEPQLVELPLDPGAVAEVLDGVEGGADARQVLARRRDARVVAREVEREAGQAGARRREERRHLALGHRDHGLLRGDPVAEPAGAVLVLAQELDPLEQVPGKHAFVEEPRQVPDRDGDDDVARLDHLAVGELDARARRGSRRARASRRRAGGARRRGLGRRGHRLPELDPAADRLERVARGALEGVVELADVEVLGGGVLPPLRGDLLQHRDRLPDEEDPVVGGVAAHPLAQRGVIERVELLVRRLDDRLDAALQALLRGAAVELLDRLPAGAVPERHRVAALGVLEREAEQLAHAGEAVARVLDEVGAEADLVARGAASGGSGRRVSALARRARRSCPPSRARKPSRGRPCRRRSRRRRPSRRHHRVRVPGDDDADRRRDGRR